MKTRDPYFDLLKFVAILMVVFGHVLTATTSWGPVWIKNFLCGCNMPLFFMISGYFARNLISRKSWAELAIRVTSLLWPALLFSFCLKMPAAVVKHGGNLWVGLCHTIDCFRSFWFLWVLSACFVVIFLAVKLFKSTGARVAFATCLYLLSMFLPWDSVDPLLVHADNFRHMVPYFAIGYVALEKLLKFKGGAVGGIAFLLMTVIAFVQGDVRTNGLGFYWAHLSFFDAAAGFPRWLFLALSRWMIGIVGCVGMMWLVDKMAKIKCAGACLACFGMTTLGVYILHQDILRLGGSLLKRIPSGVLPFAIPVLTILLFLICHYAVRFSQKNKLLNAVVWCLPRIVREKV